jgi:hypothetical protein
VGDSSKFRGASSFRFDTFRFDASRFDASRFNTPFQNAPAAHKMLVVRVAGQQHRT